MYQTLDISTGVRRTIRINSTPQMLASALHRDEYRVVLPDIAK